VTWYALLVAAVALERLAELVLSRRHLTWSLSRGGREHGRGHYPPMVALHSALLAGCLLEAWLLGRPFLPALGWSMLALLALSQALRWWCIATLGRRWNTRIVVVPGLPRITGGPYRFVAHPNYVAVVAEGLALPLVHTAWLTAVAFTLLDIPLLVTRIRAEDRALDHAGAEGRR
jgi:methyltransferase